MKNINKTILFVQSFPSYLLKYKICLSHEYYFHIFFIHITASNCVFLLTILYRVFRKFFLRKGISTEDYQRIILKVPPLIDSYR